MSMDSTEKLQTAKELKAVIQEQVRLRRSDKRPVLTVSSGTCGRARGSAKVIKALRRALQERKLEHKVRVKVTGCHGFCEAEPNIIIFPQNIFYQKVDPKNGKAIITETVLKKKIIPGLLYKDPRTAETGVEESGIAFYRKQKRILLADNALIDPTDINDYFAIGGYGSLLTALTGLKPEDVIEMIKKSGLRGRGGAGFPTGLKWESARRSKGELKYIICNADEGDPGAYMDRSLLEGNPNSVLEGMIIGAYAIGGSHGYIYVRHEYPLACKNAETAITQARKAGFLGKNILGSGFSFDVEIAKGGGAFVCGESTALISSIE